MNEVTLLCIFNTYNIKDEMNEYTYYLFKKRQEMFDKVVKSFIKSVNKQQMYNPHCNVLITAQYT